MAEADYEALTEALMQTRRGRWFLTEHARRCREADHDDLRTALTRIEHALAAPREPAGLAGIQEKLDALPRIEQALADYRDPPAMAELRESLGALARIEHALAAPREPAGLAAMQEKLDALPRIEQALAEPREPAGIAELHEKVATFAQTLHCVRTEVMVHRPPEPDLAERARDREREEEMLRLLREQREKLDALADIWARVPAAPPPVSPPLSVTGVADTVGLPIDERNEPAPTEPHPVSAVGEPAIGKPAMMESQTDQVESTAEQAPMLFSAQTPTAALLSRTMIFGPLAETLPQTDEVGQAGSVDGSAAVDWTLAPRTMAPPDEPTPAANTDQIIEPFPKPASTGTETIVRTHREVASAAHPDPIVQMFIDPEPPAAPADQPSGAGHAGVPGAPPVPEETQLPAWLVGAAAEEPRSVGHAEGDDDGGATDASLRSAELEAALQADVIEDISEFAAEAWPAAAAETVTTGAESFAQPKSESPPETEFERQPEAAPAQPSTEQARSYSSTTAEVTSSIDPPDIAELTLDLLKKALFSDAARADEFGPAVDPADPALDDPSTTKPIPESDLHAAIAALRRMLGRTEDPALDGAGAGELVMLDDLLVRPPSPVSSRAPEAEAPPPDPLAPINALSEEERIALFS